MQKELRKVKVLAGARADCERLMYEFLLIEIDRSDESTLTSCNLFFGDDGELKKLYYLKQILENRL